MPSAQLYCVTSHMPRSDWSLFQAHSMKLISKINSNNQIDSLNTAGEFQDKAVAEIGRVDADVATDANIIPNRIWDEDWSIASNEPTNNTSVPSNTTGRFLTITIA